VLVVEADLRHPALHRALGIAVLPAADFATQLQTRVEGGEDDHWYVLKCSPSLHVLISSVTAPELVLSTHFEDCLGALRPFYDVVIVCAPALSDVVGCRAVSDVVEGVVLAGKLDAPLPGAESPFFQKGFRRVAPAGV
jgi:Mrp family chromosome partitioning ATPase